MSRYCSFMDWDAAERIGPFKWPLSSTISTHCSRSPGSGHSSPPHDEYTIAGFADAMWKLMDHLQIAGPNIVGFSLGGAVALEMAAQRPSSVPRIGPDQ